MSALRKEYRDSAPTRHLELVRFHHLHESVYLSENLECWPQGPPFDLLDDLVFHASRFPAYVARVTGDDDGDYHDTVQSIVLGASLRLNLPSWYHTEWDAAPGSRTRKTGRNIATWCAEADEERLRWMRRETFFEPWITMQARDAARQALHRHAVPALVTRGWPHRRIAQALGCSPGTVSHTLAWCRRERPDRCPASKAPRRWTTEEAQHVDEALRTREATENETLELLSVELGRTPDAIRRKHYRRIAEETGTKPMKARHARR